MARQAGEAAGAGTGEREGVARPDGNASRPGGIQTSQAHRADQWQPEESWVRLHSGSRSDQGAGGGTVACACQQSDGGASVADQGGLIRLPPGWSTDRRRGNGSSHESRGPARLENGLMFAPYPGCEKDAGCKPISFTRSSAGMSGCGNSFTPCFERLRPTADTKNPGAVSRPGTLREFQFP